MSSFEADQPETVTITTCPDGHPVSEHDLFCPVCLEVVSRTSGTYWTINDGRDLHPSSAGGTSGDKEEPLRQPGRLRHRKRP